MSTEELRVFFEETEVGRVLRDGERVRLIYDEAWRAAGRGPLSVSLPIAIASHDHDVVAPFLENLLPDNERVLERWARRFQVSARNPFKLLAHVGEECAGAFSFVHPSRFAQRLDAGEVEWLTPEDVAARLRMLHDDVSAWRLATDHGQFSLAGAQPKIALLLSRGRWGVPAGRTPTTHILKPPVSDLEGHAHNEHLCLSLARALGLPTASAEVMTFEDQVAIVVERYDRVVTAHGITRVHQEDLCQALSVRPTRKYQNEGGPGAADIVRALREHSSRPREDVATFLDALVFNWLIAGTDAHAKNYSLLHGRGGRVRLAPLYDLASALPYFRADRRRLKLAMKIGTTYRLHDIRWRDWEKLAGELEIDPDRCRERIAVLANGIVEHVGLLTEELRDRGLGHPVLELLRDELRERAIASASMGSR